MANRFDIPGNRLSPGLVQGQHEQKARRAERDNAYAQKNEMLGPTYQMVLSDQTQDADPQHQEAVLQPHGVPAPWQHPDPGVLRMILVGAPRVLPVSQRIARHRAESRSAAFAAARESAYDMAVDNAANAIHDSNYVYRDRRPLGRRYRGTNNYDELDGPQEPYDIQGRQADVPTERYRSVW